MTADLTLLLQEYYTELDPELRQKHLHAYNAARKDPRGKSGNTKPHSAANTGAEQARDAGASSAAAENTGGSAQTETDSAADYRNDLFEARHIARKKHMQYVDRFLGNLMALIAIYNNPGLFPKRRKKEVLSILGKMELDDRPVKDGNCREVLYLEYRHAIRRYFTTCAEGPYASKLLGLAPASKEDKERQRCYDTWAFSYGIASMVGLEQELALLCRAADDEYCASVPGTASLQEAFSGYRDK